MRRYSLLDRVLMGVDQGLRTLHSHSPATSRLSPTTEMATPPQLSEVDRALAGRLMRVNHAGEIAAQGLYQGQALTARNSRVREQLQRASAEENDHLAWCDQRLQALGTRTSYLGPFWYWGSYAIGALAGLAGDRWSLGFVGETERQVVAHLEDHLHRLPPTDQQSCAVLEQIKTDEGQHALAAARAGAPELPGLAKHLMRLASKVMTETAYWI